jgi:hypothetical protein
MFWKKVKSKVEYWDWTDYVMNLIALPFFIICILISFTLPVVIITNKIHDANKKPETYLISTTPDGVSLWMYNNPGGHPVYFSSKGTENKQCYLVGKILRCDNVRITNPE